MNIGFGTEIIEGIHDQEFRYSQSDSFESDLENEMMASIENCYDCSKLNETKKKHKNQFQIFMDGIPTFEYDISNKKSKGIKNKENEFCKIEMKNNRFLNYFDAFLSIAEHCHTNNQKFTRANCRVYLKDCYIIDFSHDRYIPITSNLSPKLFNKYFRQAERELKYL